MVSLLASLALAGNGFDYNHTDVRWHTLETEHFFIYWPESKKDPSHPHYFTAAFSASALAKIAEESYPAITEQFDYDLKEKTHVMLYDQDIGWEGNGFAIAELDQTGFPGMWGPLFRQRGRMEFLEDVFVHEFAHIVSLKVYLPWSEDSTGMELGGLVEDEEWLKRWGAKGPLSNINADIGVSMVLSAHTPYWWAEGGAEYWSHQAGYNFWGTSREAYLRMAFLEDRVLDNDQWTTRIDKEGADGELGYNQGYSFGLWLHDRYDRDVYSEMAKISGERWHWTWDKVVEEATGEDARELYDLWYADRKAHYEKTRAEVEARGMVAGREMWLTQPLWEKEKDEDWEAMSKREQEEEKDGETSYIEMPSHSPDGRYMAWFDNGLYIRQIRAEEWGAIGGEYVDPEDTKAAKEWSRKTTGIDWPQYWKAKWSRDNRIVVTGSEDVTAPALMDLGVTMNLDGKNWNQLVLGEIVDDDKQLRVKWKKIPNTLRAEESAWHPDGQRIAFSRYDDGTTDLYMINADGTGLKRFTQFGDGTQIQGLEFDATGTKILTSLFKNYQQDLFLFDIETGEWQRLTDSAADEVDPTFGPDGRVWFASDLGGISNIWSLDLETGEARKQTEVLGHAYGPDVSPEGHLFYSATTGHGFRIFGVPDDELKNEVQPYPGICGVDDTACIDTEGFMLHRPKLADAHALSKPYHVLKAQMPFNIWPVLRTTDKNVEIGASAYLGDYAEEHYLEAQVTAGKDNYLYLGYFNDMFWPHLNLGYSRYQYKGTYGYGNDLDGVPETDDVTVVDLKFEQVSDDVWLYTSYYLSDYLYVSAGLDYSRYSFRDTGNGAKFAPYLDSVGIGAYVEWSPHGSSYAGDDWINPRGGRRVIFDYQHRISNLLDPEIAGTVYDDGQRFDRYHFNRFALQWTEYIPLFSRHTLQLDFEGGFIDRNVIGWDEFIAGGRHPYAWGNGTIGNNVQFSGYEGYSLYGETMLIANASYRFPVARDLDLKIGPTYTDAMYLQFFGSAGNLWSYRVEGDTHIEGYSVVPDDPSSVRREIPFKDYSAKNSIPGKPNYVLTDAGVELRVRQFIWNDFDWDSFLRVSYGFRPTAGYGDVNADLIQSSVARDAASELSAEYEKPTFRVYAGLGTGW
ncbi:MAG: PD40 domain-containing protein [Alphaproteobacteria bacterium]|nr:PD40 domain-containing protein [Alphaproteobacteria bacterium]